MTAEVPGPPARHRDGCSDPPASSRTINGGERWECWRRAHVSSVSDLSPTGCREAAWRGRSGSKSHSQHPPAHQSLTVSLQGRTLDGASSFVRPMVSVGDLRNGQTGRLGAGGDPRTACSKGARGPARQRDSDGQGPPMPVHRRCNWLGGNTCKETPPDIGSTPAVRASARHAHRDSGHRCPGDACRGERRLRAAPVLDVGLLPGGQGAGLQPGLQLRPGRLRRHRWDQRRYGLHDDAALDVGEVPPGSPHRGHDGHRHAVHPDHPGLAYTTSNSQDNALGSVSTQPATR